MGRGFRYFGKKRGNRRTGSPVLGSAGEAVFWAAFLVLGCGGAVAIFNGLIVPEWRVNHAFIKTTCKVLDKRIGEKPSEDGPIYRPEIRIEYEVGGEVYRDWRYDIHRAYSSGRENAQAVIDQFDVYDKAKNNLYPCWYDPSNRYEAVLVIGYRWWVWLVFTIPLIFVLIGAGGLAYTLLHWGKSAEHRAAMSQRAVERDFFGSATGPETSYPSVPRGADMANSPGTRLKFRLPMAMSTGWALFGALAFCLVWNGVVAVFATIAVKKHIDGKPEWTLTLFVIPFILIGLGAIAVFLRQLLMATGIGPTLVEISDHPLCAGEKYQLFLSQAGRLAINTLRASLVCEESATYRQGTNTRTENKEVYRQELFRREGFLIESGIPFETELELNIREGAMHSFKSEHNEINWSIVVESGVAGWRPNYKRSFSIVIRPPVGERP